MTEKHKSNNQKVWEVIKNNPNKSCKYYSAILNLNLNTVTGVLNNFYKLKIVDRVKKNSENNDRLANHYSTNFNTFEEVKGIIDSYFSKIYFESKNLKKKQVIEYLNDLSTQEEIDSIIDNLTVKNTKMFFIKCKKIFSIDLKPING